jgi:PIN domain nuclease of toxin-antitoxin system
VKLLLDTHAFLWWINDDARFSRRAREACASPGNTMHLSLASVWEIQIKLQTGKLQIEDSLSDALRREQAKTGMVLEPIALLDILELAHLPMHHRDPFDRMLIAQARVGGFTLVSDDRMFPAYDVPILW